MPAPFEDDLQPGLGAEVLRAHGYAAPTTGLGGMLMQAAVAPSPAPNPMLQHQQQTIYGETAGLYPQLTPEADSHGIYRPGNWDPDSANTLNTARAWIAAVRLVNPMAHESVPDLNNGVDRMSWGHAVDAAQAAQGLQLPAGTSHFFIRQGGSSAAQTPPTNWGSVKLVKSFGPFINTGGGDVPKGNKTYIDFYRTGN